MGERKPFLLRIDADVLDAVQRWANDDLRSLNGQIEFLLRKLLKAEGRLKEGGASASRTASTRSSGRGRAGDASGTRGAKRQDAEDNGPAGHDEPATDDDAMKD